MYLRAIFLSAAITCLATSWLGVTADTYPPVMDDQALGPRAREMQHVIDSALPVENHGIHSLFRNTQRSAVLKSRRPFAEGIFRLKDGRGLGYAEYGNPYGALVLYFSGGMGSRYEPEAYALESVTNVRLVVLERPGIGNSTVKPFFQLDDWPRDVEQFVDGHFGPESLFRLFGYSAGSPYVLACLTDAFMFERIISAAIVSPLGPVSNAREMAAYPEWVQHRYRTARAFIENGEGKEELARFAAKWSKSVTADWDYCWQKVIDSHDKVDQSILRRPAIIEAGKRNMTETFKQGPEGWFWDMIALAYPWPFNLDDIQVPLAVWHGIKDMMIPYGTIETLYKGIPGIHWHAIEGAGHRFLIDHFPAIVEDLMRIPQIDSTLRSAT